MGDDPAELARKIWRRESLITPAWGTAIVRIVVRRGEAAALTPHERALRLDQLSPAALAEIWALFDSQ